MSNVLDELFGNEDKRKPGVEEYKGVQTQQQIQNETGVGGRNDYNFGFSDATRKHINQRAFHPENTPGAKAERARGVEAATATAPTMGKTAINTQQSNADRGQAQSDRGQAGQSRTSTLNALALEKAAAEGKAPSAAQIQATQGTQDAAAAQIAAANSARGGVGAQIAAARNAALRASALQRNNIRDNAALRANEMAAARGQYQQGAQGIRSQDQSQQQTDQQQQQLDQQAAQRQAELNQDTNKTNATLGTQAELENARLHTEAREANQKADLMTNLSDQEAEMRQRGLNQQDSQFNENLLFNTVSKDQEGEMNYARDTMDNARWEADRNLGIKTDDLNRDRSVTSGLLQSGGELGMNWLMSDKKTKTHIKNADKAVEKLLSHLKARSYKYKDKYQEEGGEGNRVGVMAQDLEKSKAGKEMVSEGPDGIKRIDQKKALSVSLAALADLHKRIKHLEEAR